MLQEQLGYNSVSAVVTTWSQYTVVVVVAVVSLVVALVVVGSLNISCGAAGISDEGCMKFLIFRLSNLLGKNIKL